MTTSASLSLSEPMELSHGPDWANRFALAPMTNSQSHPNGVLSDEEFRWLTMRAEGGFGLTMTCASHVQAVGQGFPGQLGCWSDDHLAGLTRLADQIRKFGSVSSLQLHHAGIRSPKELIGQEPIGPSADEETGAIAMTHEQVKELVEDFVLAAIRAEKAGFDGVEIHGAHGYVICGFLSPQYNRRADEYGGSPENRARLLYEILAGIRQRCRPNFQVGIRVSPERFGVSTEETVDLAGSLLTDSRVDYLDISLWDYHKEPEEESLKGQTLLSLFTSLARNRVRLGGAGKISTGEEAREALGLGLDFVTIGKTAILHHDWPKLVHADAGVQPVALPVTPEYLASEGVSPSFVDYMRRWPGFVAS
jgi:2,4-dienoyl-CoA reductase-like NADH-dependent reductase (Old Yellow Enzyme family)